MKLLTPNYEFNSVQEIDVKVFKQNGIRGICIDMDNTLLGILEDEVKKEVKQWIKKVKEAEYMICLVTNNPDVDRIEKLSQELEIPYVKFALKPLSRGFLSAKKLFNIRKNKKIAVIGDQIYTDILGANLLGMLSIHVKPISIKKSFFEKFLKKC